MCPDEFGQVFKQGSRQKSAYFTLVKFRHGQPKARLGLAIAKKVAPKAVWRNRIKRLVRESFRQHQSELCGWDVVVQIKQPGVSQANSALWSDLNKQWQQLATFHEKSLSFS